MKSEDKEAVDGKDPLLETDIEGLIDGFLDEKIPDEAAASSLLFQHLSETEGLSDSAKSKLSFIFAILIKGLYSPQKDQEMKALFQELFKEIKSIQNDPANDRNARKAKIEQAVDTFTEQAGEIANRAER